MIDLLHTIVDITRSAQPVPPMRVGRPIAAFASARDAQTFASMKREAGEDVNVFAASPSSAYLFEVYAIARAL